MTNGLKHQTETAILAIRQAGVVIMNRLRQSHKVEQKAAREIVTEVDLRVQEAIVDTIKAQFPDHDILAEEGSNINGSPFVWIIDPLDGTNNYVSRLPCFCTSVALQCDGEVILGLINDPFNNRLFTSQDTRHVSKTKNLADAMIAVDWPNSDAGREKTLELATTITHYARTLRSFGSAALSLCYVAAGWLDGFIHADIEPWDAAAGALIVQEAGGKVTDFAGQSWQTTSRQLIASNSLLHDELLAIIN